MLQFKIDIDPSRLVTRTLREQKRLAYAVADSLNAATKDVQMSERAQLDKKFQIRRASFMYRLIKITQFATVGKNIPFAELAIDNSKARVLLSVFEFGGTKEPWRGKNVAVPITGTPARPTFADPVPEAMTFQALGFKRVTLSARGQDVVARAGKQSKNLKRIAKKWAGRQLSIWAGEQRTFVLPYTAAAPYGGVFQRYGPKPDDIRMIYSFRPRPRLRHMLNFVETARDEFQVAFTRHFNATYKPEP
jgi:hypothetical protein